MLIEIKHYQLELKRNHNNLKKCDEWKRQLTIANNFFPSIDHNAFKTW